FPGRNDIALAVRIGGQIRFVRQFRTQTFKALELFESSPVIALGLDAITEREVHQIGFLRDAAETFGNAEITVLLAGDFDVADHVRVHGDDGIVIEIEDLVHGAGEEAGIETSGPENELLGYGHALEREHFLRVDRPVAGDEIGFEVRDFVDVFETDDAKRRSAEGESALSILRWFRRRGVDERLFGERGMRLGHRFSPKTISMK